MVPAPTAHAVGYTQYRSIWSNIGPAELLTGESAVLPVVGEALGGSSTHSSRCGTCPVPFPPPVQLSFSRRPIVVNAVTHKQASGTLCSKTLRIFRSVGPAPPAQYKQVIQALRRRLLCKYRCVSDSRGDDGWKWYLAGTMDGNGAGGLRNGGWGSVGGAWAPRACHTP